MTESERQNLRELIVSLQANVEADDAILQFWENGRHENDYSIRANGQGLQIMALEPLKAAAKFPETLSEETNEAIQLEDTSFFIDGDVLPYYVEPTMQRRQRQPQTPHKPGLSGKLIPAGCISVAILLLVAMVIGPGTIGRSIVAFLHSNVLQ